VVDVPGLTENAAMKLFMRAKTLRQPPDKQGNNRDGVVAIIGLMVKRAFAITGGIRGRNKGKNGNKSPVIVNGDLR
jgi:hypothetical protein